MSTTLKQANEELEKLYLGVNDENEDTPELLAEQLKLIAAVTAAEAADLTALSTKQLVAHFNKRAPGEPLAKGLSKAALIAKIGALPPLEPLPTPEAADPTPSPEPTPAAGPEVAFSVAGYAAQHGLDGRELRKKLRAAGLRAPYTLEQVEKVVRS